MAFPAHKEHQEPQEPLGLRVLLDNQVLQAVMEMLAFKGLQDQLDLRERVVVQVSVVLKEIKEVLVKQEVKVNLVHRDQQDQLVIVEVQDLLDHREIAVLPGHPVSQETEAQQDQLEVLGQSARLGQRGLLDHQVFKEHPDLLVRQVIKVFQDL